MYYQIPISSAGPQMLEFSVPVGGENIAVSMDVRYNTEGNFWRVDIRDGITGSDLIGSLPLLCGEKAAANLLRQVAYLGLGEMIILPMVDHPDSDRPVGDNLGTDFLLIMGTLE